MKPMLILAVMLPFVAHGAADDNLKQKLAQLEQFSAQFNQQVYDEAGQLTSTASGELSMQAPDRMRWQQQIPDDYLIIADGQAVWVYEPFMEAATVYRQDDAVAQTPVTILTQSQSDAWQQYDVSQQGDCYTLAAKEEDSQISAMKVCFDGQIIKSLTMNYSYGGHSDLTLTGFTTEAQAASLFEFVAPEGTEIDDQRGQ
ncbi:outer membrane lipoprotein chaperone LolA [Ferrimonas aestuarii]|nr:outer membrane lipoprotein chaperone LolA [Ferrimonas aestuarii]